MMHNPYNEILELSKGETQGTKQSPVSIGHVISVAPLVIRVGELKVDSEDILIADHLNNLRSNDRVAVLAINENQTYIVVARLKGG